MHQQRQRGDCRCRSVLLQYQLRTSASATFHHSRRQHAISLTDFSFITTGLLFTVLSNRTQGTQEYSDNSNRSSTSSNSNKH